MAKSCPPSERVTVDGNGRYNRRAILGIAHLRAAAARDLDVIVAKHRGPLVPSPPGVSFHNLRAWRAGYAANIDRTGLRLTPFRELLAEEMRLAWATAGLLRNAMLRERAALGAIRAPVTASPALAFEITDEALTAETTP